MLLVLEPERGRFTVETVKRWAVETLFAEEGIITTINCLSVDEAINILHRHNFARIKR
jgi:hypothetical protein